MTGPQFTPRRDAATEPLDENMTTGDLVDVLAQLRFGKDGHCLIVIDKGIRDYLLRAIKRQHP